MSREQEIRTIVERAESGIGVKWIALTHVRYLLDRVAALEVELEQAREDLAATVSALKEGQERIRRLDGELSRTRSAGVAACDMIDLMREHCLGGGHSLQVQQMGEWRAVLRGETTPGGVEKDESLPTVEQAARDLDYVVRHNPGNMMAFVRRLCQAVQGENI